MALWRTVDASSNFVVLTVKVETPTAGSLQIVGGAFVRLAPRRWREGAFRQPAVSVV